MEKPLKTSFSVNRKEKWATINISCGSTPKYQKLKDQPFGKKTEDPNNNNLSNKTLEILMETLYPLINVDTVKIHMEPP